MRSAPSPTAVLPLALLASANLACVAHVDSDDGPPLHAEVEPNDSAHTAPFYGGLDVGDAFGIVGHVTESGFDLYDGFAVRVDAPLELVFDLASHAAYTDLDVCVYDPDLGEFVVCADAPYDPEHGSVVVLEAGKVLHLVVTSAAGDAGYTLQLAARPVAYGYATQSAPADGAADERKAARRRGYAAPIASEEPAAGPRRVDVVLYDLESGALARADALVAAGRLAGLRPAR